MPPPVRPVCAAAGACRPRKTAAARPHCTLTRYRPTSGWPKVADGLKADNAHAAPAWRCNGNLRDCYSRREETRATFRGAGGWGRSRIVRPAGDPLPASVSEMHLALSVVAGRFPNVRERAANAFEHDESFRELCEEYQACTETVARLSSSTSSSEAVRKEYAALLFRLEGELLRYLQDRPGA